MSFLSQKDACSNNTLEPAARGTVWHVAGTVGVASSICILAATALAQDVPEGARRTLIDVRTGLEWSDNPDLLVDGDSQLVERTSLDFSFERRTAIDLLTLDVGTDLVVGILGDSTDGPIENADARLRWDRDVGHARLGLGLRLDNVQLNSSRFVDDVPDDSVDFNTFDGGSRRTAAIELDGAFGVDRPLGATYQLRHAEIRYEDTDDPTLLDAQDTDLRFSVTAALDRTTSLGLIGSLTEFDETGTGARDTRSYRLGGEFRSEITPTLTGRLALGYQDTEQSGSEASSADGIFVESELTWTRPNGTAGLLLDSPIDVNGRRTTVRVFRSMELPRGAFGYSVGLSHAEGLDTRPLVGLNWEYEMPRATFIAELSQTPTTSRDNVETVNSVLSLNYIQELTTRSALDILFSMRDANEEGTGASDSRRVSLDVTYRQDLSRDWNLIGQFSTEHITETGSADRNANTVFVGLEKRFGWN